MTAAAGYYAVPDPDQPAQQMTYWHLHVLHLGAPVMNVAPWPPRARYGPVLLRKDVPKDREGRIAALRAYDRVLTAWNIRLRTALAADPAAAAARFAELSTRCFCCARKLRSDRWKVLGIGPECFQSSGLDYAALLASTTPSIAAAHAVFLAQESQR